MAVYNYGKWNRIDITLESKAMWKVVAVLLIAKPGGFIEKDRLCKK